MPALAGRRIILGVCGSIAAYKAVPILRGLQQEGAEVRAILTDAARQFVQPLTFATLSRYPVYESLWQTGNEPTAHVDWAEWADALLVAPASAHSLAKFAHGLCDNFLTAVYLSARCPVFLAPAMDLEMYRHPALQRSLQQLAQDGCHILEPEIGFLSSGLEGKGRLPEPETVVAFVRQHLAIPQRLARKRILITAGPTRERIDPVRYLTNDSTGKMGIALAQAARDAGADVHLLLGPTDQSTPAGIRTERFTSAADLESQLKQYWPAADILIMSAAVADYRPAQQATQKIKKQGESLSLELVRTTDLVAWAATNRSPGQVVVGFALETQNEETHARQKLETKGLDLIVLNSLADAGAGFGHDTNRVRIFDRNGRQTDFPLMNKTELARLLIQPIADLCSETAS